MGLCQTLEIGGIALHYGPSDNEIMNKQTVKSQGKHIILRRIQLSFLIGVSITVGLVLLLGLLGDLIPFRIAKFLFWPALLFIRVHGDDDIAATYYFTFAIPLSIPAYSLLVFAYLTLKGLPRRA
jgi:hypothetical protein